MRYVRAYTYDTHSDTKGSEYARDMQKTRQWLALMSLLYELVITVLY